jgi:hypothetical protein
MGVPSRCTIVRVVVLSVGPKTHRVQGHSRGVLVRTVDAGKCCCISEESPRRYYGPRRYCGFTESSLVEVGLLNR